MKKERIIRMKKRVMLLVVSLSIVMLAGGCGSKNDISNYQNTNNTDNAGSADQTTDGTSTDGTSTDGTSTDGTDASVTVPEKADYKVDDYIKLGQYKGVKVTVDQLTVTDDNVNTAIQDDLKANATTEEVTDRKDVQNGDIVNIDYEGLKDGKAFDGGTSTGYDLTIGSGKFIPGFEDKLIGAKVGEKVSIDLTFPADYQQADLAGQAVVFNVTVNSIKKQVIPELTEEYVKSKTSYDTIDAYKEGKIGRAAGM
jgi:trigger factor